MLNVTFLIAIGLAVAAMIWSDRVKDGVIIRFGLSFVSTGFVAAAAIIAADRSDLLLAINFIGFGVAVCLIGAALRIFLRSRHCRRVSDWVDHNGVQG